MYPRTKDTQAVRNIRLSPPALKITVIQPENGQRKLSVERDPFRGAGRVPRAKLSCSSALSHLILLPPRLNTHLLPTPRWKRRVSVSPSLSLACLLQNNVGRDYTGGYEGWAAKDSRHAKVQRAGLGEKEELCSRWTLRPFIVVNTCTDTSSSKHWRNRNRFKVTVLLWLLMERKAGSCPGKKGQEKEHTLFRAWHGRRHFCSLPATLALTFHPILCWACYQLHWAPPCLPWEAASFTDVNHYPK